MDLEAGEAFFDELADRIRGQVMRETLQFSATRIGARATTEYMQDAGFRAGFQSSRRREAEGPLRILQGRLARSLTGARTQTGDVQWSGIQGAQEGIASIAIREGGATLTYGSRVPYAVVHETGMTLQIPTTDRMRRFFWAKYYESLGASMTPRLGGFRRLQRTTQAIDPGGFGSVTENRDAQRWKAMAIAAREQSHFSVTIRQRAFLGPAYVDEQDEIQRFLASQVVDAYAGTSAE